MTRRIKFKGRYSAWILAIGTILLGAGLLARLWPMEFSHSTMGNYLAARSAYEQGDSDVATLLFARALARAPNDTRLQASNFAAHLWRGDYAAALMLAPGLTTHETYGHFAKLLLAVQALRQQDWEAALAQSERFGESPQAHLHAEVFGLWIALQQGAMERVTSHMATLENLHGYKALTDLVLAQAHQAMGDIAKAKAYYRDMTSETMPMPRVQILTYAQFLGQHGSNKDKSEFLRRVRQQFYEPSLWTYARAILRTEPSESDLRPKDKIAQFLLADAEVYMPQLVTERILLAQLGLYSSDTALAQLQLAKLYQGSGHWREAQQHFGRISSDTPYYRQAQITKALMLQQYGQGSDALVLLERLTNGPARQEALAAMADIHRLQENYPVAEDIYTLLLADEPTEQAYWPMYFARGVVRERLNKWASAENDLLTAKTLSRDNPLVLNYLGYSWVNQGIHLRRALEMIQDAVRSEPRNGAFVDSLGWAYFRLGDLTRALRYLERAAELDPTEAVIIDHLGDALWHKGRKEEARAQWQRVLDLEGSDELYRAVEQKLRTNIAPDYRIENSRL